MRHPTTFQEHIDLYKQLGFYLVSVHSGKGPIKSWLNRDTDDFLPMEENFDEKYGVALVADENRNKMVTLDLDSFELFHKMFPTEEIRQQLYNRTMVNRSGRGIHILYRLKSGKLENKPYDVVFDGKTYHMDLQVHRKLTVLPPTKHKSGVKYQIISKTLIPAEVDAAVIKSLLESVGAATDTDDEKMDYDRIMELVHKKKLTEGGRNNNLFWLATYFIKVDEIINREYLREKLETINQKACDPPLQKHEIGEIVTKAFNAKKKFVDNLIIAKGKDENSEVTFAPKQFVDCALYLSSRFEMKKIGEDGKICAWNGLCYDFNWDTKVKRKIREVMPDAKTADVNEVINYITDTVEIVPEVRVKQDASLVAFQNAVVDVRSMTVHEKHDSSQIVFNVLPYDYKPAPYPTIVKFLSEVLTDPLDYVHLLQFVALALLPYEKFDLMQVLYGPAGTGKSTLATLFAALLGEDNIGYASVQGLAADSTIRIGVADKILNIDHDMSAKDLQDLGFLKRWISNETMTDRAIYSKGVTYRPRARLLVLTNKLFDIENDVRSPFFQRVDIRVLDTKFRGTTKVDPDMADKITKREELQGFMAAIIKVAHILYKTKKMPFRMSEFQVETVWGQHANVVERFVRYYMQQKDGEVAPVPEVNAMFIKFCKDKGFNETVGPKFKRQMKSLVGEPASTRKGYENVYGYMGWSLINQQTAPVKEGQKRLE